MTQGPTPSSILNYWMTNQDQKEWHLQTELESLTRNKSKQQCAYCSTWRNFNSLKCPSCGASEIKLE